MWRKWVLAISLALLSISAASAQMDHSTHGDEEAPMPPIAIVEAWLSSDEWAANADEYAVGLTLMNMTEDDILLTSVEADDVIIAYTGTDTGIVIPAGETAAVSENLGVPETSSDLVAGDAVLMTLTFTLADDSEYSQIAALLVVDEAPEAVPFAYAEVWARPVDAGGTSAVYLHLINLSEDDDTLVAAATAGAMLVEIHEMAMEGDVMRMREIEGGVPVAAGAGAILRPGGLHIMLMEIAEGIPDGFAIPVTLTFESGLEWTIAVPVYDKTMMDMGM
jgi:copper(I)-binding protein